MLIPLLSPTKGSKSILDPLGWSSVSRSKDAALAAVNGGARESVSPNFNLIDSCVTMGCNAAVHAFTLPNK